MPQKPKKRPADSDAVPRETETWGDDQKRHEYYYDDAHGYEVYDPEEEVETDDDECEK